MYDESRLVRDGDVVKDNFKVIGENVLAKKDCSIVIPYSYLQHNLARTGDRITIASVFAVIVGDKYGVMSSCASIVITPAETNQIKLFGLDMLEFVFPAGSMVCSESIVKDADLAYDLNKNFYSQGRVPWFMNYDDVGSIFLMHQEYTGLVISPDNTPFELVTSRICRSNKDRFKHYRFTDFKENPVVVPFNSVLFNATNTTAKLLGNYLSDGFTSALLSPSDTVETVETLLRR